jgi:hypothetical protein
LTVLDHLANAKVEQQPAGDGRHLQRRAGPGIVLASVAFDAGILNASFFTTLMVTAVVISGLWFWHGFVLRKGWSLLKAEGPVHKRSRPGDHDGEHQRAALYAVG